MNIEGRPDTENTRLAQLITEEVFTFLHGIVNGNHVYSSTGTRSYLFWEHDGRGPLKPMFNLSMGWVTFIRVIFASL